MLVIAQRHVKMVAALALQHEVVGERFRCHAEPARTGGDALLERLLVIRRIAEQKHVIEFAREPAQHDGRIRIGGFGEDALAHLWPLQFSDLLRERKRRELHVRLAGIEGVEGELVAQHHADGAAEHLRLDRKAGRRRIRGPIEHVVPAQGHGPVRALEQ